MVDPDRGVLRKDVGTPCHTVVWSLAEAFRSCFGIYSGPSFGNIDVCFYWKNHVIYDSCLPRGNEGSTFLICTDHWRGNPYSMEFEMDLKCFQFFTSSS